MRHPSRHKGYNNRRQFELTSWRTARTFRQPVARRQQRKIWQVLYSIFF